MKKSIIFAVAFTFCALTSSYSQKTTSSTASPSSKQQPAAGEKTATKPGGGSQPASNQAAAGADKATGTTPSTTTGSNGPTGQQAQKTTEGDASTRPGGAEHKNANDVGRYSENEDAKSMTHSKEALAERQKNLTESDTTLKKGSGSAPKNMKNHTGKTGNYQNQEIKHNQKTQPRP